VAESDAELAGRVLAGSDAAARELVRRYERPVFNLIVRMVRDPALAEDLAQETFVKALTHLATYDSTHKFASWLLKIAHNTTIDYLRRPRPPVSSIDDENASGAFDSLNSTTPSPLALAERSELAALLDVAIDRLRPEYRQVVILRCQEDLSYEEIAEVLGLPMGTVKSYLHRARAELADAMTAAGWSGCNTQGGVSVGQRGRS
jgi:RNA polymerase sigma-70 factor (ECF subfamily)